MKVLELAELQRRLDASEEERQRVQAELQAEQARLSSAMVDMAAVSSKLQVTARIYHYYLLLEHCQ